MPSAKKRPARVISTLLVMLAIASIVLLPVTRAAATSDGPVFDPTYLKGIDIVYVTQKGGPKANILPWPPMKDPLPPSLFFLTVKEIFGKQPWVTVTRTMERQDEVKPNVLTFEFVTSAREEVVNGRPIKVGALALQLWHRDMPLAGNTSFPSHAIPIHPITYPFVALDSTEEFQKQLVAGVHYLVDHLPNYFACANQVGKDPCHSQNLLPHTRRRVPINDYPLKRKKP